MKIPANYLRREGLMVERHCGQSGGSRTVSVLRQVSERMI